MDAINGLRSCLSAGANMRKGDPGFYRVIERLRKIQLSGAVGMHILKESDCPRLSIGKESLPLVTIPAG